MNMDLVIYPAIGGIIITILLSYIKKAGQILEKIIMMMNCGKDKIRGAKPQYVVVLEQKIVKNRAEKLHFRPDFFVHSIDDTVPLTDSSSDAERAIGAGCMLEKLL